MKWQIKMLGDVCGFQNGFAFKSNLFREKGLPILRISNIQNESFYLEDLVYFNPKDYKEEFSRYVVNRNDLVIAMSGGTTGKIGISDSDDTLYLNQRVGKFSPKKDLLNDRFLYYFLSTRVEENLRISAGSAQPNLSTEQINVDS